MISFDIETAGRPRDEIIHAMPQFDDQAEKYRTWEFQESDVKFGNLKDEKKIQAKIEEARQKHIKDMELRKKQLMIDKSFAEAEFLGRAALDPALGCVIAIGFATENQFIPLALQEELMLEAFWKKVSACIAQRRTIVGHNILEFDLRFLFLRSKILGVGVPQSVISEPFGKWPKWNLCFVDTRKAWLLGNHGGSCKSNFDHLAVAFGTGGKFESLDGGQFAELLETQPEVAFRYLEEDCRQPLIWAQKMGVK